MKALRVASQGPIESHPLQSLDLPLPQPGPDQLRLRVRACGVCRTDLHTLEGDIHPPRLPITPGHQVVAVVEQVGEGVRSRWQVGDRVGVPWLHQACRECEYCRRGEENLCPNARFTGFHVDGGFAEYMLAQADYVLPLPANLPDPQVAPLLCAGIVGYRSLHMADLKPGERLGLFGFGASAHLSIQVALHWGCEVYVFTRAESHRQHALELGAAWVGGAEDAIPKSLDRAVIFAPAGNLVPHALEKVRPAGTVAINAIHTSPIPEMPYQTIYEERTLRSVANATYEDGLEFLSLAAKIPVRASVQVYPFQDADRALLDLKNSRINGEAVLDIAIPSIRPV